MSYYQKHLFFCTNQRSEGRACCQNHGASEMRAYAKKRLQAHGLWGAGKCRVSTAGCLGRCALGPNIVVYPDNIWYHYKTKQDIDEIIEKHLQGGHIVERLVTKKPASDIDK